MTPTRENWLLRIVRAPFFLLMLVISLIPVLFIFASVSVGSWAEELLHGIGYRARPRWLPAFLGVVGYSSLGVAAPAWLGSSLLGWPGAVLGPILTLGAIAILGHW